MSVASTFGFDAPAAEWLGLRARATPYAIALRTEHLSLDYRVLERRVAALEQQLRDHGVAAGQVIALALESSLGVALVTHAVARLSATLLPLNLRLTPSELGSQLDDAQPHVLILGEGALAPVLRELLRERPSVALLRCECDERSGAGTVFAEAAAGARRLGSAPEPTPGALLWLFTSGTTGRAKAVELSDRAILASARGHAALLGLEAGDCWLICMPLFHIGGLSILWRSVLAGSSVLLHPDFDAVRVKAALASGTVSWVSLVPTMLRRVLDVWAEPNVPGALRCILLGGAGAPELLLDEAQARGFPIAPTYGLSEAASQVATRPPREQRSPRSGHLRVLPGSELRIRKTTGELAAVGELGEIELRSPTLMTRYVARERETAATLAGGWLRTGDLGRLDEEGALSVEVRRDDLIVSGGENIAPAEVEAVLASHEDVEVAAVVALDDREYGQRPFAFVVAAAGAAAAPAALRSFCREHLAGYKVPVEICAVPELPFTASGKLKRAQLREQAASYRATTAGADPLLTSEAQASTGANPPAKN